MAKETKTGRPPKYKTPEELQAKAEEYFKWCDNNPIRIYKRKSAGASQTAKVGSGVKSDEGEAFADRPYTFDGLALWLGIGMNWRDFRAYHIDDEFSAVINVLDMRVRDQQVSGAMVGVYNPNLTARLNGIADTTKTEATVKAEVKNEDEYAGLPIESQKRIAKVILEERHKHYQQTHDKE